jgi:Tol biopolymer transport system component
VGLLAVSLVTYSLVLNPLPLPQRAEPTANAIATPGVPIPPTSTPSGVVGARGTVAIRGSVAYVKSGEVFVQTGTRAVQITTSVAGSVASAPVWSPDGQWVYYIDTRLTTGSWLDPDEGGIEDFLLTYPVLCRVAPDGTGEQDIKNGLITYRNRETFFWMIHPSISPDGTTVALISDGPTEPGVSDDLLRFIDLQTGSFLNTPRLRDFSPYGQSDPTYSPDGKTVAYVTEARKGNVGDPGLWLYDTTDKTARQVASGYRNPSWSPDGKYLAVAKSGVAKPDVAIIDASSGQLVGQITSDGLSWAPVWSPDGDAIIYSHLAGSVTELRMAYVSMTGGQLWYQNESNLIDYQGLDSGSAAAWYIPPKPAASGSAIVLPTRSEVP